MIVSDADLDRMQSEYRAAVGKWVAAIRAEEDLASVPHTVAEIDRWEGAYFAAEELRSQAQVAKSAYESALRGRFFGID